MSPTDHRIPQSLDDWMRDIEKRLGRQERRLGSPAGAVVTDEGLQTNAPVPWLPKDTPGLEPLTEPPTSSPDITVVPFSDSFLVYTNDPLESRASLEFEVSTEADFDPIVLSLSDAPTVVTLGPLAQDTDYWVRTKAYNEIGAAPPGTPVGPVRTVTLGAGDIPDLADVIEDANQALLDALAALEAAQAAQDTADHRVQWGTSAPVNGVTEGSAGDIFYVKDGSDLDAIYEATGDDTWAQRFVAESAIGTLAVGKITGLQGALDGITGDIATQHVINPSPVLVSNSPVVGSIAWPSFTIKYGGHTLNVPAGDTLDRYVVYRWSGTAGSIEETSVKPTLAPGDMILFVNNAGIAMRTFATVLLDGDLLVDGTITGDALAVNSINTDHIVAEGLDVRVLTSGVMNAAITISGVFKTAESGRRIEMRQDGLYAYDEANNLILSVPTDQDAPIGLDAEVTARNLDVLHGMKVSGNSTFAAGAVAVLGYRNVSPVVSPQAVGGFPTRPGLNQYLNGTTGISISDEYNEEMWAGAFAQSSWLKLAAVGATSPDWAVQVGLGNPVGSGIHEQATSDYAPMAAVGGCVLRWTSVSEEERVVVLGKPANGTAGHFMRIYNLYNYFSGFKDNDTDGHSVIAQYNITQNSPFYTPKIGHHYNRNMVAVAQPASNGGAWNAIEVKVYNWESGALISTFTSGAITELATDANRYLRGVAFGRAGIDATERVWIALPGKVLAFTASGVTLTRTTTYDFNLGHGDCQGFTIEQTQTSGGSNLPGFRSVAGGADVATVYSYTNIEPAGTLAGKTHYVTNTWGKKAVSPATGYQYETGESPVKQVTWPKRGQLVLSVPFIPTDGDEPPDSVVFYVGSAAPSTLLNRWLQAELTPGLTQQVLTTTPITTGVNPPDGNDFPEATPAWFVSEGLNPDLAPNIILSGDGSWRLGGLQGSESGGVTHRGHGLIGHIETIQVTTAFSGSTAFNVGTISTPLVNGATYRALWNGGIFSNTVGALTEVLLKYGVGAGTGGTIFAATPVDHRVANRGTTVTVFGKFTYTGTDGATNNIVAVADPNSGTSTLNIAATRTCFMTLERIA